MKMFRRLGVALLLAATAQGCATTGGKKIAGKKKLMPSAQIVRENYALMDDSAVVDREISIRGNKARGLSDY
jgi:hypothetical protein